MRFSGPVAVKEITQLSPILFSLRFVCRDIAEAAAPGQFVQVRFLDCLEPLWPRPFSIHDVDDDEVILLVKVVGRMTRRLVDLKPEHQIWVTGPLGNGFPIPQAPCPIWLVAGGIGLPPLHFLLRRLLSRGYPPSLIRFYVGAKSAGLLAAHEAILTSGVEYVPVTEDGSLGKRGLVTGPLAADVNKNGGALVFACGPPAMLREVARLCANMECYLSLEQLMPCGWGVCNGCAVKIKIKGSEVFEDDNGFRLARVCKEGPVFRSDLIQWSHH